MLVVDATQRAKTSSNHSATLVLHQALRKILEHI
jgi:alanyl-tRNA synthetase